MSGKTEFYLDKLDWLGPILVRGLGLLSSVETLEQTFSFSQVMVLQAIHRHREMRMTELADYLGLSKANATGLIDRLVKRDLVTRARSEKDRRVVRVMLTEEGGQAAERLAVATRLGLKSMISKLPERRVANFMNTLEELALGLAEGPMPHLPNRTNRD